MLIAMSHFVVTSSQINLSHLLVIYYSLRCLQHTEGFFGVGSFLFLNQSLHLHCRFSGLIKENWENLDQRKSPGNVSISCELSNFFLQIGSYLNETVVG